MENKVKFGFVRVIVIYMLFLVIYGITMIISGSINEKPDLENLLTYLGLFIASVGIELLFIQVKLEKISN
jgi:hypothetical protein